VLVEPGRCIGCAMCAVVCPFDVLTFHPLTGGPGSGVAVAVKCDGCVGRLEMGLEPACSEVCKVDALVFGELNELVAAGRLRETGAVLAVTAPTPTAPVSSDPLQGWRAWGEAAARARAGAEQVDEARTARGGTSESEGGRR
jgi:Fe-S-cluster-containing dehydrogenase component